MFSKLAPNLIVFDVNLAVAFCGDVLRFNVVLGVPAEPPGSQEPL